MSALFFPIFVGCFLSFVSHRRHFLYSLLALEAIILSSIVSLSFTSSLIIMNFILIIILVFAVAEARLGLSVLVSMSRFPGNDIVAS